MLREPRHIIHESDKAAGTTTRGPIPGSGKRYFCFQKVRTGFAANPTAQPLGTEGKGAEE
jgi:hypothetical protein